MLDVARKANSVNKQTGIDQVSLIGVEFAQHFCAVVYKDQWDVSSTADH